MNELTEHSKAPKLSGKRLSSLDGLRGIAVLSVVAFHTLRVTGQEGFLGFVLNRVQESAWAGVDLSFVVSGFLITGILLDTRDSRNYFQTFFARRTLRIFLLYYAVLAVAIIAAPAILGRSHLPDLYPRLLATEVRFIQLKEYFTYSTPERSEKPSAVSLETQFPYLTGVNS